MSRWLAGCFDPGARVDSAGLAAALAPSEAEVYRDAPLHLAFSGPPAQPGPLLCLFDGSLDNAGDLRAEIGEAGAGTDPGGSPEQLLAAAYRHWGSGLPERMRGDFVLLVWDSECGEGILARDQLGVRPLFLHEAGGALRFAGELRQLLALLPRRPQPDPASVAHWISVSSRPGDATLYSGVRRLGPGEMLQLDRRGWRDRRYWKPRYRGVPAGPEAELADAVRAGLGLAVERRRGDSLTGVLMSGGLDSSAIAALCVEPGDERSRAYSAVFPEHPFADEAELIGELGAALELPGIVAEVRPGGLVAAALEHLAAWQAPLLGWGDFWALPLLRAAAAEGVTTMLDGDGGDELFGPRSYLMADRLRAGHPLRALALTHDLPGAGPHVPRREVARVASSFALGGAVPYRLQNAVRAPFGRREAPGWLSRRAVRDLVASDDPYAWKRLDGPRWWAHAAHGIASGIEAAGVFEHQRRRAAMAGLEARHPMLDLDLVELALAQPPEASLDRRYNRPLLRAAMEGLLPDAVRLRPGKARFESLIVSCLTGPDAAAMRAILSDPRAELGAYLDLGRMRAELLDSEALLRHTPFRWMWHVWRLLSAELWLRSQSGAVADMGVKPLLSQPNVTTRPLAGSYLFPP